MKKALGIIMGFLFLNSCGVSKETANEAEDAQVAYESISFDTVGKGSLSGAGEEGIYESNVVVQTEVEWELLISKMNSVNHESENFSIQEIDFEKFTIIVSIDKVQNTGGHSIRILDIQKAPENLIVIIKKGSPGEMATSVMTQPYFIVRIPKTEKTIVFK